MLLLMPWDLLTCQDCASLWQGPLTGASASLGKVGGAAVGGGAGCRGRDWVAKGGEGEGGASVITNTPWYFLLGSFHVLTLIDIGAISWYFQHLTNLLVVESHLDSCTSSLFRERKLRRISMNWEEGGGGGGDRLRNWLFSELIVSNALTATLPLALTPGCEVTNLPQVVSTTTTDYHSSSSSPHRNKFMWRCNILS